MSDIRKNRINGFRTVIAELSGSVLAHRLPGMPNNWPDNADLGEFNANITLAFRHLEDARMRLGKAIQALDGGVSVYDKSV